jgi:hypothetical protein
LGPLCVIAALLGAEAAAYALSRWPTSEFLWYVNLELFRNFQYCCDWLPQGMVSASYIQLACGVAPLAALILLWLVTKARLALAIASSASVLYAISLLWSSFIVQIPHTSLAATVFSRAGTLHWVEAQSSYLTLSILAVSLVSCCSSHVNYFRLIRRRSTLRSRVSETFPPTPAPNHAWTLSLVNRLFPRRRPALVVPCIDV